MTDLLGLLKGASIKGEDFLITPENFAEFITLIYRGKISSKIAKTLLEEMFSTGGDPSHIIKEKGLSQITDESEIEKIVKSVMRMVLDARNMLVKVLEHYVNFIMKELLLKSVLE